MEQEIKNCWRCTRFSNSPADNKPRRHTALQQLIGRYKRFSRISLIMTCYMPFYIFQLLRNNTTATPLWLITAVSAFMMIYCLTASVMENWLSKGLSSINIADMPVVEVCNRALYYRKRHFQFIAVLLPMCLILLVLLAWLLSSNQYIVYGIATGAVIGIVIGLFVLNKFLKEYKNLTTDE